MNESDIIIEPDLLIQNGDIVIKNANEQNIKHILIAFGNYLLTPDMGAGLYRLQNSNVQDYREIVSRIKQELKRDGYINTSVGGPFNNATGQTEMNITAERVTIAERSVL